MVIISEEEGEEPMIISLHSIHSLFSFVLGKEIFSRITKLVTNEVLTAVLARCG